MFYWLLSYNFNYGYFLSHYAVPATRPLQLSTKFSSNLDPDEVPVLVVADLPGRLVINVGPFRQWHSLAEVDEPDASLAAVVHEQQGAADQLEMSKPLRP